MSTMSTHDPDDLSPETAKQLTIKLKAEVKWLIKESAHYFDPYAGMVWDQDEGRFVFEDEKACGTCILGAWLLHQQPANPERDSEPMLFAEQHRRCSYSAARAIYQGAMLKRDSTRYPRAAKVALDVLRYARSLGWSVSTSTGGSIAALSDREYDKKLDAYEQDINQYMPKD